MTNWVKSTEFYTNPDNSFYPLICFFNSVNDPSVAPNVPAGMTLNIFTTIDLKPHGVAEDAKYALIGGIFLITGNANITLAFRAPGSTQIIDGSYYDEQALSPYSSGGDRSVIFNCVPLVNGCLELNLKGTKYPDDGTPFQIGQTPAVGVNLKLKGWGR